MVALANAKRKHHHIAADGALDAAQCAKLETAETAPPGGLQRQCPILRWYLQAYLDAVNRGLLASGNLACLGFGRLPAAL